MGRRLDLHNILKSFVENVYFQPPANTQLSYPCIIYSRASAETRYADNQPYTKTVRYMVTVIDRDPDSVIPDKVASLPGSTYNRFYTTDDLNHDVYNVFF